MRRNTGINNKALICEYMSFSSIVSHNALLYCKIKEMMYPISV